MSWSYNTSLATDKDTVRFLIGDTDTTDQQLSDEEINGLLTLTGSTMAAAIRAARGLAAKYSRRADKWVGDLKILASQKAKAYLALAEELENGGSSLSGTRTHQRPFAGGISVAGKEALEDDDDWPRTSFQRGMHDNGE